MADFIEPKLQDVMTNKDSNLSTNLQLRFPIFHHPALVKEIIEYGVVMSVKPGDIILETGNEIQYVPLVLEGSVKVVRGDGENHEVMLYYIREGESCALTLSSCIKREKSTVKAIAEARSTLLLLPVFRVYQWMRTYPTWHDFLVNTYAHRFEEMLDIINNICFQNTDERLRNYLAEKSGLLQSNVLHISHQEIANDLGVTREVISRLLKQMERKNQIKLYRERIDVTNI